MTSIYIINTIAIFIYSTTTPQSTYTNPVTRSYSHTQLISTSTHQTIYPTTIAIMPIFSGLGQRRGSKTRELHIRKISFSGCSLSESFSSDSSSSTLRAHTPRLATSTGTTSSFDGLSIHSSYPPKRLHDRPFIMSDRQHYESAPAFYDSEDAESSDLEPSERDFDGEDEDQTQFTMELPHASPVSNHDYGAAEEPQDYFFMHIASRPKPVNQSRWSDSRLHQPSPHWMTSLPGQPCLSLLQPPLPMRKMPKLLAHLPPAL